MRLFEVQQNIKSENRWICFWILFSAIAEPQGNCIPSWFVEFHRLKSHKELSSSLRSGGNPSTRLSRWSSSIAGAIITGLGVSSTVKANSSSGSWSSWFTPSPQLTVFSSLRPIGSSSPVATLHDALWHYFLQSSMNRNLCIRRHLSS